MERTQARVARDDRLAVVTHLLVLVPVRMLETARVRVAIGPDAMIGVGLDLFLAAAELVALLGLALLLPFVHLDLAHEAERIGGDAKLLVGERRARRKIAAHI